MILRPSLRLALFGPDFNERRMHQKAIFYRLPARPVIKLFYMLFVRRAVLDGWAGIRYSILQAIYEYFIVLKTKELKALEASDAAKPRLPASVEVAGNESTNPSA
jgi:hypothetical protein